MCILRWTAITISKWRTK